MTEPVFSVLLTTLNRATSLHATLTRLAKLDAGGLDWEVIVVDNGSSDDTPVVLSQAMQWDDFPLRTYVQPAPGKSRALNLALEYVRGELIIFVDDDVLMAPDWLQAYSGGWKRWPDKHIFGGQIRPLFPEDAPVWVQDPRYVNQSPMFARYEPADDECITEALPHGPNMAITRRLIGDFRFDEKVGPGGDYKSMGCETEFVRRLIKASGEAIVYVPDAFVHHVVRPDQVTKKAIWSRAYKWGRSKALVNRRSVRGVRVFGVPLKTWFAATRSLLRFAPFYFGPQHWHLRHGWKWHVRRGQVSGYLEARRFGIETHDSR